MSTTNFPYINQWLIDVFPNDTDRRFFLLTMHKIVNGQQIEPLVIKTNSTWDNCVMRMLIISVIGKQKDHQYSMNDHGYPSLLRVAQDSDHRVKGHLIEMAKVVAHDILAGAKELDEFKAFLQLPDTCLS
jgi:hypothetical protein